MPAEIPPDVKVQMASDLRRTVRELRDRGLMVAAKWASELLMSLPREYRSSNLAFSPPPQVAPLPPRSPMTHHPRPSIGDFLPSPGPGAFARGNGGPSRGRTRHGLDIEEEEDVLEEDEFQLARGYFDLKEYDRSADRKAQESLPHFLDTKEERMALYPALSSLVSELRDESDPYLIYLRGLCYMRLDRRSPAIKSFMESFISLKEELPSSPMLTFFAISCMLDLHTATDLVMTMIKELLEIFPSSVHLQAQRALVYYHMRDFEAAEQEFDNVQKLDRFRMEEVDIYSNMLYVMNKQAKLGKLAHEYAEIDRNRAEVCCLIGNYYSSRSDHTKAITYFKRSLMLNREYLPAWTLMGHEFVELKNSHAAIEAYRKAIDVNTKDYRAWYGLGQAYELLDMPMYAIEYYNQATSLRPYDCRMWTALATVYENLRRIPDAILAHTRALLGADRIQTMTILLKLAGLHITLGQTEKAVGFHRKAVALGEKNGMGVAEMAGSFLTIAEWEMRSVIKALETEREMANREAADEGNKDGDELMESVEKQTRDGDMALAAQYLEKVSQTNAPQRDRAEELLRSLRLYEMRIVANS
ncbi:uncharacterized protein L203_100746 [Cryptococcus depauperatus CBS 7841]|uniref:Cdc23 domain-containing protein n=1 Tax=Cryptococcus depauperatus CBS 7841 TaxID=1295531 RepID=A0AAJ8JNK1_9TREE